jgi:hypothetical protein
MMAVPDPTPIYHLTHWRNLPSILAAGGVLSNHEMLRRQIAYQNIAYDHIQERRETTMVFGSKGGCLHDYVPFHFAPKSPMLFTISRGNVPNHTEGQDPLVYLVSTAQAVAEADLPFIFTDGHATMNFTEFFEDLAELNRVDWKVMHGQYWNDTPETPDRKRRRQAEFLVHRMFPTTLIEGISVKNDDIKEQVLGILRGAGLEVPVQIKPSWYY